MSKFVRAGFLIFGLVFVSRDFEVGTNCICEESTVSSVLPYGINLFKFSPNQIFLIGAATHFKFRVLFETEMY